METYHVLFNPKAGNGRGKENARELENVLAEDKLEFYDLTQIFAYPDFFSRMNPEEKIVICGGDGTLNYFVNHT